MFIWPFSRLRLLASENSNSSRCTGVAAGMFGRDVDSDTGGPQVEVHLFQFVFIYPFDKLAVEPDGVIDSITE